MERSSFAQRVAQARRELAVARHEDVVPSELARLVGVSPKTVYAWERGANMPARSIIERLADVLGVLPAWLEFGSGDRYPGNATGPVLRYEPTADERAKGKKNVAETDAEVARRKKAEKAKRDKAANEKAGPRLHHSK